MYQGYLHPMQKAKNSSSLLILTVAATCKALLTQNKLMMQCCEAQQRVRCPGDEVEPNIGPGSLKFGTLIAPINTWGCFFHFFKIFISWSFKSKNPKNFGAGLRAQYLSFKVEIWHTWSSDKYLGVFFSFFQISHFLEF